MTNKILLKRSLTTGSVPTTSSLDVGELAINVPDGKVFVKQSGSSGEVVRPLLTLNTVNSGSVLLTGSISLNNGSLIGTSSWATNATSVVSSSYALTASFALNGGGGGGSGTVTSITAGDGLTGGTITTVGTIALDTSSTHFISGAVSAIETKGVISSSNQINQLTGVSASFAVTASYLSTYPALTFDGGTPSSIFTAGPIFDLGGVT